MSSKKSHTKSSSRPKKAKKAVSHKAASKKPRTTKATIARELKRRGIKKLPSRITKKQLVRKLASLKAKDTRARKLAVHEKRSAAARLGWAARKAKSPDVAKWERTRRKLQATQKAAVEAAERAKPKWSVPSFRWYNGIYFAVTDLSTSQLHVFLVNLKARGVRMFRFEREVIVGEYTTGHAKRSASGYISSVAHWTQRLSNSDLLYGNSKYQMPSLASMRVPGIDFIRFVVMGDDQVQHLPEAVRRRIHARPIETRETIPTAIEQTFYLRKGRKPTAADREEMDELQQQIQDEMDDDSEIEGDEE